VPKEQPAPPKVTGEVYRRQITLYESLHSKGFSNPILNLLQLLVKRIRKAFSCIDIILLVA